MSLADDVRTFLTQNEHSPTRKGQDPSKTRAHYGIPQPELRAFIKTWSQTNPLSYDDWITALDDLYAGNLLEEKLFAGILLDQYPTYRRQLPLSQFDTWLGQLDGWQEVDNTCQSTFSAKELLARWDEWETFLRGLSTDDNINKRRASIVLLLPSLSKSPDDRFWSLAVTNINQIRHEKDKLITKAISWVLRTSIRHHRDGVMQYIAEKTDLPAFVVREVETKLKTGKKLGNRDDDTLQ
jgi:3-methyladenine DNA glycosylase AlkD